MTFSDLLAAVRDTPQAVLIPQSWAQGRASFGGLVAAQAFEAMRAVVEPGRPLRSLALTFVGPVQPEVPVRFEAECLREGRAVSHVSCRLVQDGQVVTLAQASFGLPRESIVAVDASPAAELKPVEACQELPFIRKVMPAFTQHIAMRWSVGGLPFSANTSREMGGWMRFRSDVSETELGIAHLLALIDAWPPATLSHLRGPAPSSSLTWTVEFVQPLPTLPTSGWLRYLAEIEQARDGYGHIAARCWSEDGQLLAISRQTATIFG
ncbi:MAG: hypothetical protein GAK43_01255 [Stenotrophomonas maltophilia]|nr:MAG: hypothetical protein GAK43_01255 [Stenotrophomonas maltophilia]